ncbi:hypothetical protein O3P69_015444 [Scylla paramamosain]|uniref:Integrase p58-like C-terminal domain-containing protein n=1 Tax=Scylla paramamosain TaxID=85552 RepID=A0AAW0T5E8_SCYPA
MCGRELRLPVDLVTGRPPDEDLPTTITQYATALQDRLREVHHQLQSPWEGPYVVEKVISDVTFRIRQGPRKRALVVHADRLWGYHGPGSFSWGERAALLTSDEEEDKDKGLGDDEPLVMEDDGDLDLREPEPLVMEEVLQGFTPAPGCGAVVFSPPYLSRHEITFITVENTTRKEDHSRQLKQDHDAFETSHSADAARGTTGLELRQRAGRLTNNDQGSSRLEEASHEHYRFSSLVL